MMMRWFIVVLTNLVMSVHALTNNPACKSCIIESFAIKDVIQYVNEPDSVVVFDLDNTLIYTGESVGSHQWFNYLVEQYEIRGLTYQNRF